MSSNPSHATNILSHKIKPEYTEQYLTWAKKINAETAKFDGFESVTIIKPNDLADSEYVIILQFRDHASLKIWKESDAFANLLKEAEEFTLSVKSLQEEAGMEIWFDWPKGAKYLPRPPKTKQILIAASIVLPFVFVLSAILDQFPQITSPIRILILVFTISTYIAFVMPLVTKHLHSWCYPQNPKP